MESEIIFFGRLDAELEISFTKSSGPGGQSVNKLNTKAMLRFDIENSNVLTEDQKSRLLKKLKSKIVNDSEILLTSQVARSQIGNKELVIVKFYKLINKALKPEILRRKTKPTIASMEKRLQEKREKSEKKSRRKID